MKRFSLIAMLLLGGTLNAHADNDIYGNITKHPRAAAPQENARRLEWSKPPGAKIQAVVRRALEHAEHDGSDKSDCHIGGHNAQSTDKRT